MVGDKKSNLQQGNVVLLHGLGRTKLSMSYLGLNLKRAGFNVINFGYPSRKNRLDQNCHALHDFIRLKIVPGSELNFVCHSLGGLVARKFINIYRREYRIKRIVMFGTPNQGSKIAKLVGKVEIAHKILGPALKEINDHKFEQDNNQVEIGVIAGGTLGEFGLNPLLEGDNDGIVSIKETELEGMRDFLVVPGIHSFLMYRKVIINQVISFLIQGRFSHNESIKNNV